MVIWSISVFLFEMYIIIDGIVWLYYIVWCNIYVIYNNNVYFFDK